MAETTRLDAPIVAVTVFRDGARVQRSGPVNGAAIWSRSCPARHRFTVEHPAQVTITGL